MEQQSTASRIFMVRPASFGYNVETSLTNAFQKSPVATEGLNERVLQEFDAAVRALRNAGIDVMVFEDTASPIKPDAIFPNNWVSLHADGTLALYPMCAGNRRTERREDILTDLKKKFVIKRTIDFSIHEKEGVFLEGTGSIVFDHANKKAFACLSPRTDRTLLCGICKELSYEPIIFTAKDKAGKEIYHTNVMMCICPNLAVICTESIADEEERKLVLTELGKNGREVVEITADQMARFAGNMLGLKSADGKGLLVLSQSAHDSLTDAQRNKLRAHAHLLPLEISTIEAIGGGSARCMIAEIFSALR